MVLAIKIIAVIKMIIVLLSSYLSVFIDKHTTMFTVRLFELSSDNLGEYKTEYHQ